MDNYPIPIGTGIQFPRVKQYTLLLYCSNHELQYTDTTQLHVYTVPIQYRNWIVQTQMLIMSIPVPPRSTPTTTAP